MLETPKDLAAASSDWKHRHAAERSGVSTLLLLLLSLSLAACATAPRTDAPEAAPTDPHAAAPATALAEPVIDARVVVHPEGRAEVSLSVPLAWYDASLPWVRLAFRDEPFAQGPSGFARFVTLDDGAPLPDRFEAPGETFTVRYQVDLAHQIAADPKHGIDEVARATKGGLFFPGRAVLPERIEEPTGKALDTPTRLELVLPEGWTVAASWDRDASGAFVASSLSSFAQSVFYTGRFTRQEVTQDGLSIAFVSSDFDADGLAPALELTRRLIRLATQVLGPPAPGRLLFALDAHPQKSFDGALVGRDVSILTGTPPLGRALDPLGRIIVHELVHLWNRGDTWWLGEGFTRYLEVLFVSELDNLDAEAAAESILALHDGYLRDRPGEEATIAGAEGSWAYEAGAVAAFCLDGRLRESGHSLWTLHRQERESRQGAPLAAAGLLARLEAASPVVARDFEQLLALDRPVPFEACLARAGIAVEEQAYRGFSPRALALEVLKVGGYSTQAPVILKVRDGSIFQPGDELLRVGTRPIGAVPELDWLLSELAAGDTAQLEVLRDGKVIVLELTLPALDEASRPARTRRSVVAGKGLEVKDWLLLPRESGTGQGDS